MRLLATHLAALRFLRTAIPRWVRCFAPDPRERGASPELVTRCLPPGFGGVDAPDLTRSWGILVVLLPCSSTPAGPAGQALQPRHGPRLMSTAKAHCIANFGALLHGFGTHCLHLVRIVQPLPHRRHLAPRKARLAAARSTGRDWLPVGFQRKVSESVSLHVSSSSPKLHVSQSLSRWSPGFCTIGKFACGDWSLVGGQTGRGRQEVRNKIDGRAAHKGAEPVSKKAPEYDEIRVGG